MRLAAVLGAAGLRYFDGQQIRRCDDLSELVIDIAAKVCVVLLLPQNPRVQLPGWEWLGRAGRSDILQCAPTKHLNLHPCLR
jgi:hypothetical protein